MTLGALLLTGIDRQMSAAEFELLYPTGLRLTHALGEQELLTVMPDVAATRRDMQTGWVWYSLPQVTDGDVLLSISLAFFGGRLASMAISDANPRFGTDWGNWSEDKERLRARSIADWFVRRGTPPARYDWGEVWAAYDPKGGVGAGGVRYA